MQIDNFLFKIKSNFNCLIFNFPLSEKKILKNFLFCFFDVYLKKKLMVDSNPMQFSKNGGTIFGEHFLLRDLIYFFN